MLGGGLRAGTFTHAAFAFASKARPMLSATGGKVGQGSHAIVIGASGRVTEWSGGNLPFGGV